MRLEIHRYSIQIVPESDSVIPYRDGRDTAFIEEVLGLRKSGDSIKLVRKNAFGLGCIAYLETERDER